jgi:6-phosphogluconolactonase (cycloisomerase 2 family)
VLSFRTVPSAITLVRWVNENAFVFETQTRPCPTFGRPVHLGFPHRLRPGTSPHAFQIPSRDGHPALRSTASSWFTFVHNFAIVTEAGPSALSSYEVDNTGELELLTGSLGDTQTANCWVVVTRNGRYAFTTNTGSGTISSYVVSRDGTLSLLNAIAGNTGAGTAPIDMALSNNSHFLYVREATKGMVDGFRVESDGSLAPVGSAGGVPAGAQGVAAR